MSLMKRFYTDRYLHIRSFTTHTIVTALLCLALYQLHAPEFFQFRFEPWHLALIPLGLYVGGVSAVFIHNATHNSFRWVWLNEFCGYLSGLHQLWGFTGWKLIHLVHHQYSDNADMDPHPPKDLTFWQFTKIMFVNSSRKISERYREHWGQNRTTRIMQKWVMIVFPLMVAANLLFWYMLLGPAGFLFFYIPSYISNHLLFVDVNYSAHPKDESGNSKPANLNHTLYYKIANALWFGIYFHGNHHRRPLLFNPRYMQLSKRHAAQPDDMDIAA
jgi:fatty acid desaturase